MTETAHNKGVYMTKIEKIVLSLIVVLLGSACLNKCVDNIKYRQCVLEQRKGCKK